MWFLINCTSIYKLQRRKFCLKARFGRANNRWVKEENKGSSSSAITMVVQALYSKHILYTVADLGFPVGGALSRWWGGGGGADLRRGHFPAKTYAKMKELDPVWGGGHVPATPAESANSTHFSDTRRNRSPVLQHSQVGRIGKKVMSCSEEFQGISFFFYNYEIQKLTKVFT